MLAKLPYSFLFVLFFVLFGTGWKCWIVSIFFDTFTVSSLICLRMYFMNALLDHHPIIMIAKTKTLPRYIAIAAPNYKEWVPTLFCWIRIFVLKKAFMALQRAVWWFCLLCVLFCYWCKLWTRVWMVLCLCSCGCSWLTLPIGWWDKGLHCLSSA